MSKCGGGVYGGGALTASVTTRHCRVKHHFPIFTHVSNNCLCILSLLLKLLSRNDRLNWCIGVFFQEIKTTFLLLPITGLGAFRALKVQSKLVRLGRGWCVLS